MDNNRELTLTIITQFKTGTAVQAVLRGDLYSENEERMKINGLSIRPKES